MSRNYLLLATIHTKQQCNTKKPKLEATNNNAYSFDRSAKTVLTKQFEIHGKRLVQFLRQHSLDLVIDFINNTLKPDTEIKCASL